MYPSMIHQNPPLFKIWGKTKDEIIKDFPYLPPVYVDDLITYHHPGVRQQRLQQKDSDGQHKY